jgi:hypothetical protein
MALGVVTAPGILLRLDDVATAPTWVWIGSVGWLGTYVAYPAWAVWLGIVETRLAGRALGKASETESGDAIDRHAQEDVSGIDRQRSLDTRENATAQPTSEVSSWTGF